MDRLDQPRTDWRAVMALFVALLAVATFASLVTPALIPTLGLLVVGAGLFLPPRATALVGGAAVLLAGILVVFGAEADYGLIRFANVLLASVLAVLASLVLARRMQRVEQQSRTETALLGSVPDALFVLDLEGRVRLANAGLTNLVPGARVGEPLHALLGHVRADGSPCPGGCVFDAGTPAHASVTPVEGERITRGGQLIQVAYTTQPLQPGVAVSLRDVSARVAEQSELRALREAAAHREEQSRLLRALASPVPTGAPPLPGVLADVWREADGNGSPTSDAIDLSLLPDDRILALVVDPTEEGSLSPRDTWRVLYAARAHMAAGAPLADMVSRCAQILTGDAGAPSAALLAVVIDPDTGIVQVASGGHLPPLLIRPDGSSTWLEATGQAIGSARAGSHSIASAELMPGDLLLLYTNEVVTGRGDLVEGLSSLRSASVALRHQPSDGWARRALAAVQPGSPHQVTLAALRFVDAGPVPALAG